MYSRTLEAVVATAILVALAAAPANSATTRSVFTAPANSPQHQTWLETRLHSQEIRDLQAANKQRYKEVLKAVRSGAYLPSANVNPKRVPFTIAYLYVLSGCDGPVPPELYSADALGLVLGYQDATYQYLICLIATRRPEFRQKLRSERSLMYDGFLSSKDVRLYYHGLLSQMHDLDSAGKEVTPEDITALASHYLPAWRRDFEKDNLGISQDNLRYAALTYYVNCPTLEGKDAQRISDQLEQLSKTIDIDSMLLEIAYLYGVEVNAD